MNSVLKVLKWINGQMNIYATQFILYDNLSENFVRYSFIPIKLIYAYMFELEISVRGRKWNTGCALSKSRVKQI